MSIPNVDFHHRLLGGRHPDLDGAVVKLNDGFSGEGNASFRFRKSDRGARAEARVAKQLGSRLAFEAHGETWRRYREKFSSMGGIVEARVTGDEVHSPSAQCRIDPRGHIEVVSTHEQRLGGPSGQVFVGCEFPARETYRARLQDDAERVGRVLRDRGALGRFSVDFVAVRRGTRWLCHAIEINLRKGGTTHPFLMLDFLIDGHYERQAGVYQTPAGQPHSSRGTLGSIRMIWWRSLSSRGCTTMPQPTRGSSFTSSAHWSTSARSAY